MFVSTLNSNIYLIYLITDTKQNKLQPYNGIQYYMFCVGLQIRILKKLLNFKIR